jgi:hypothetical protein
MQPARRAISPTPIRDLELTAAPIPQEVFWIPFSDKDDKKEANKVSMPRQL